MFKFKCLLLSDVDVRALDPGSSGSETAVVASEWPGT